MCRDQGEVGRAILGRHTCACRWASQELLRQHVIASHSKFYSEGKRFARVAKVGRALTWLTAVNRLSHHLKGPIAY